MSSPAVNKSLIPCLQFSGACGKALGLYKEALNAKVQWESKTKDDRFVMYSSIVVGDCQIIAWDSPETIRAGTQAPTSMFSVEVDDVDAWRARALQHGFRAVTSHSSLTEEPGDMFWGATTCTVQDPYGHTWVLSKSNGKEMGDPSMEPNRLEWQKLWDGLA